MLEYIKRTLNMLKELCLLIFHFHFVQVVFANNSPITEYLINNKNTLYDVFCKRSMNIIYSIEYCAYILHKDTWII